MASAYRVPEELDWVTERANCTAYKVFKTLQLEVEKDVKLRQSRISAQETARRIAFSFEVHDEITFSVMREGVGVVSTVQFRLADEKIIVRGDRNQTVMTASLTLNDYGKCLLRVSESASEPAKDAELITWQFRRRALEQLFFDIPSI